MNDIDLWKDIVDFEKFDYTKPISKELYNLFRELYIEESDDFDLIKEHQNKIYKLITIERISFNKAIKKLKKEQS
tara:strand:- start:772 stop:996 length:225 start_codon:yes stop_codon:yes gene_type:complete